jgi:hypothetical protein
MEGRMMLSDEDSINQGEQAAPIQPTHDSANPALPLEQLVELITPAYLHAEVSTGPPQGNEFW